MKAAFKKLWRNVKRNPVRVGSGVLSALAALATALGLTDTAAGIAQILLILGGGEAVRAKVRPVGTRG
jgi:hypothetical protein